MTSLEEKLQNSLSGLQWKRIGTNPHIGINLSLSSLRSKNSSGIGEFLDLIPLIKWCSKLKMDVIQLLPLNDSGMDPSPYNALSSCALHPIYLSLTQLPYLNEPKLLEKITSLQKLNALPRTNFQSVLVQKTEFLTLYFQKNKENILASPEYIPFLENNPWIRSYALFKVLREKNKGQQFSLWPEEETTLSNDAFEGLFNKYAEECSFHIALQYLCFSQLTSVKNEAQKHHILLKGDIPILISPDSADVWFHPELFDLTLSVGAPPDQYSAEGQYWGFPKPKWDEMRKNDFLWWKNRLKYASCFYDLYRIDHVIGLFRLWVIPVGRPGHEGKFTPSDESLWEPLGRELLKVLTTSSSMLPLAEDLGVVPLIVRPILEEFGICGTKVMRWERNWKTDRSFIDPATYPKVSLTCISTHDSTTLEEWWNLETEESEAYAKQKGWEYIAPLPLDYRRMILQESVQSQSLFHINLLSEYLALVPDFVASDPKEERINVPGTLLPSNWTYRFRRSIEEMSESLLLETEIGKVTP